MDTKTDGGAESSIDTRRRGFVAACAAVAGALAAPAVLASEPRSIRMVVPFAPGGASDVTARLVGKMLGDALGQVVVIENSSGGGGSIAASGVARAEPDGATLLFASDSLLTYPLLHADSSYQLSQFEPLVRVRSAPVYFGLNPAVQARTVAEFVALAKARPGQLNYASPGVGSLQHLATELFRQGAGIDIVQVPFRGASQVVPETVSGRTQLAAAGMTELRAMVEDGKLMPFAATGTRRSGAMPAFPTFVESGYPDVVLFSNHGVFAPKGIPAAVARRLTEALSVVASSEAYLSQMRPQGLEDAPVLQGAEFADYLHKTQQVYATLIKNSGMTAQ